MVIEDPCTGAKTTRRVPLEDPDTKKPAATVAEAVRLLQRLRVQREDRTLPVLRRTPQFSEAVADYLAFHQTVKDAKRSTTIGKERSALTRWTEHMGETRVDRITRAQVNAFIAKRQANGVSGRTVNLDVIALRNCLKKSMDDGWLKDLPTRGLRPLKWTPRTRELVTPADIDRLCGAASKPQFHKSRLARGGETGQPLKNAQQFADYIRLMAFSGARMREALRLKWTDVDFERKQLTIGATA